MASSVSTNNGSYSWSCTGSNGVILSCRADQRIVGACGTSNGTIVSSSPGNLCATGASSSINFNGTAYTWSCSGNYGPAESCSATYQAPPPPSICEWTSQWSNVISLGTNYTLTQPAYVAYGSVSNYDYGNTFVPVVYDYRFINILNPAVTVPPGMSWVLALDSSNVNTHAWKYSLVGTPTMRGSFGGGYWASCGLNRGDYINVNININ